MRPIGTDGVAWSLGLSVTIVSPTKTAEPIEMPFGLWSRMGTRLPMERGNFEGERRPTVKYRDHRHCAAAMRPFVNSL